MKKLLSILVIFFAALASYAAKPSGTLPILHIDTDGHAQITSKETYINGTYWLDPSGTSVQAFGSESEPLPLQIRGRGNYTWKDFDKKPYRIKLGSKAALLGCKKSKHFALLAHADDKNGFLRNAVGLQVSRLIGLAWTPQDCPVEVVLNGDYIGLYFLTETIRVDSDRVNIVEQADKATAAEDITGGWLLEIDNYDSDPHIRIRENDHNDIVFTYKTPEELSTEQVNWITNELTTINSMINSEDTDNCQWADRIDLDALARYYIVQEVVDDYESFHGSCYLYRERGANSKWIFGPVWDFGNAFNSGKKDDFICKDRVWHQTWISDMVRFPEFMQRVKSVWAEFYANHSAEVIDYARTYATNIAKAVEADYSRWPQYGNENEIEHGIRISSWLEQSMKWLNKQWNDNYSPEEEEYIAYFEDDKSEPWQDVRAYVWSDNGGNEPLGSWPGTECERIDSFNGYPTWRIAFTPSRQLGDKPGIIFNGDSGHKQTGDFILIKGGVYRNDGYYTGVESVSVDEKIDIEKVGTNTLRIKIERDAVIPITSLSGVVRYVKLTAGSNDISLPAGFYIVSGRKFVL